MKDLLALKVATRYLGNKLADSLGDPKENLREFEMVLRSLTIPPEKLAWAKDEMVKWVKESDINVRRAWPGWAEISALSYDCLFKVKRGFPKIASPGHKLFLSLLQTYVLPPGLRKKVEVASRLYLKPKAPNPPKKSLYGGIDNIVYYEKFMAGLQTHLEVAKQAIAKGKTHAEGGEGATKIKVGPFTIVNTGGFDEKVMNNIADVMKKATELAKSSGLGEVCYGEVQVTNTVSRSNVLAFYLVKSDELFVRANVKATRDSVQTVLHELGHRYQKMFLKNDGGVAQLYRTLDGQERRKQWGLEKKVKKPDPGDTVEAKGQVYVVEMTLPDRRGYKVHLHYQSDPKRKATVPLETFWQLKGQKARNFDEDPNYIGFVSDYAKRGGPDENFAEMFSYYCMGQLPVLQSVPFEELVFGTKKSANERLAHRFSAGKLL